MKKRSDFLAANRGRRAPTKGFVLLVRDRKDGNPEMRYGLTVSRKVGGAVVRNRMKRRFRELCRAVLPDQGVPGADHVLIGRQSGIEREFEKLGEDLKSALAKVKA
ncbi:ribonuclease P protein component [Sphingomicrobium sp. B8]|uniref:Ribonuclease P protein component n=1 Tax=Sphingomicrobium clamense TaxID=2851013 RepID=A0ABS6V5R6_9SPHN|nr:ribonuclease P protein component [Sphingomicrobium sp. B8]